MNRCDTSSRSRYLPASRRRAACGSACVSARGTARWRPAAPVAHAARRHRLHESAGATHLPSTGLQRQVRLDRRDEAIGAFTVRLVDHEDVGDLHDAGLERLHLVAGAGHQRDDRDVGGADDVDFVLADADGLDDDDVLAGRVEHERRVAGRARQAAQVSARRHAADEHAFVGGVRLHPQAIAEHGAARERARRIDRDDARRSDVESACRRKSRSISRSTSVLFPAPGGPVTPTR